MAPMKKAVAGKSITKGAIAKNIAEEFELKSSVCSKIIDSLAATAAKEVKKTGKFIFPGFCMVKTRTKPATKAGMTEVRQATEPGTKAWARRDEPQPGTKAWG